MSPSFELWLMDNKNVVSAKLISHNSLECEALSSERSCSPLFSRKAKIFLNLLLIDSKRTFCFEAYILSVSRQEKHWVYKIRWKLTQELQSLLF